MLLGLLAVLCLKVTTISAANDKKLQLTFFGEALWPECGVFVTSQLYPTLLKEGILDIVDFSFVPFGNAYYQIDGCSSSPTYDHSTRMCWNAACNQTTAPSTCFTGTLICQHGEPECYANRIEACALKYYPSKSLPFINCYEGVNEPSNATLAKCAKNTQLNVSLLQQCASTDEGHQLDSANAQLTARIPGGHESTPWPVLNGKHVNGPLLKALCEAYTGKIIPAACKWYIC